MSCSQCQGIERMFGRRTAARELRRYRRKGPTGATRVLLDALVAEGVDGATLLDIGGGVGVIQHELLAAGAASALGVDAATAYLDAARGETERRGNTARVTALHGDFVELAPDVSQADVVTLDKVICCYPDARALVGLSAARAERLYGLVFPRESGLMRVAASIANAVMWLRRRPFRIFVHSTSEVDRIVCESGLEERSRRRAGLVWQVAVYARPR
jgi:magnesium-protoporphyrin O-methyltransferase